MGGVLGDPVTSIGWEVVHNVIGGIPINEISGCGFDVVVACPPELCDGVLNCLIEGRDGGRNELMVSLPYLPAFFVDRDMFG